VLEQSDPWQVLQVAEVLGVQVLMAEADFQVVIAAMQGLPHEAHVQVAM